MSPTSSAAQTKPAAPAFKQTEVGRVLSVGSSMAVVQISKNVIREGKLRLVELGNVLKIVTSNSIVITMVSSLKIGEQDDEGMSDGCIAVLNILGEITTNSVTRETKFNRGVRNFPVLSEPVYNVSPAELRLIFSEEDERTMEIGRLQQDEDIVAEVRIDDMLSKHFAIIGSTGSGKSCTVALVLRQILKTNPNGHVVLFDPHNEYSKSFGHMAEVIRNDTLDLPLWLFNFEETVELLTSEIEDQRRAEKEVLADVLLKAKLMYERIKSNSDVSSQASIDDIESELVRSGTHISLDSPVPYRIRDVQRLLQHYMGKLENNSNLGPYKRLRRRIETFLGDPRYAFVFRNQTAPRPINEIIGRLFRVPVANKPIAILDMSGIPSETINVVVSVVSRLAFEIAMWSDRQVPILLVCEEAHRYIPANPDLGFNTTRQSISRIAKEGRKYGVSLAIISQRPSELEPSTLSQCSTIFSMRLSNEIDQNFVRAAVPDGASELLSFLPSLGVAETMVFGEAVNMPMRVLLSNLEAEFRPHSSSAKFTDVWAQGEKPPEFMANVFENWRKRSLSAADDLKQAEAGPSGAETARRMRKGAPLTPPPAGSLAQPSQPAPTRKPAPQEMAGAAPKAQTLADVKALLDNAFHNRQG